MHTIVYRKYTENGHVKAGLSLDFELPSESSPGWAKLDRDDDYRLLVPSEFKDKGHDDMLVQGIKNICKCLGINPPELSI